MSIIINVEEYSSYHDEARTNSQFPGVWAVYLHGQLDQLVNCDLCIGVEGCQEGLEGVFPVQVLNVSRPCTGYFWYEEALQKGEKIPIQRGLVVLNDDPEGGQNARSKMNRRAKSL